MLKKLLNGVLQQRADNRFADLRRDMLRHEARIGGTLFGPIPAGHRREFFCLDKHTWVWHEEWQATDGSTKHRTTRYDVRPDGVLKSQNGHYQTISLDEAKRLQTAAHLYRKRVMSELYNVAV
jgi:hypothetical protein